MTPILIRPTRELPKADLVALGRVMLRFLTEDYDGQGSNHAGVYELGACLDGWVHITPDESALLQRVRRCA